MNGNQFYRGEDIIITVAPDENEVFTTSTPSAALVYPDGLDKSAEDASSHIVRANRSTSGDNTVFTIPYGDTLAMELGDYTVEIIFGDENGRTIAVHRSAFELKRSAQEVMNVTPSTTDGNAS